MTNRKTTRKNREDLRRRAERILDEHPEEITAVPAEDVRALLHELNVYQEELEVQNEELRKAETELEGARDKYYVLYDFAPVGYFTLDKQGIILEVNRTGCDLFDRGVSQLKRRSLGSFVRPDHSEDFYSHLNQVLRTRLRQNCQLAIGEKGDNHFHIHLESMPLLNDAGEVTRILSAVIDITKERHAQEELEEKSKALELARDELEVRVQERTAELQRANEKLEAEIIERRRAEEEAELYAWRLEKTNQELQEFALIASHDLQEPLRKIQAFGNLLAEKHSNSLDEQGIDYLGRMQNAASRMRTLIEALLTYSRVATKAQPFTRVDLVLCVEEALADLEIRIQETGARVEVSDLPWVEADDSQMIQLFQNIINNSLKFHKPGSRPSVRISSQTGADQCEIFVEDDGVGFDEQYVEQIFSPFERLHGRAEYEGVGMGLAICRKIVERHGGRITARSTVGKGATFVITLPTSIHPPETASS